MRGRDRALGLRRGHHREHRADRLAGQRAPRPDVTGRPDPLRGLAPGDGQQLRQQHGRRRAAQLTGHPTRRQLADHRVIRHRQPAPLHLHPTSQLQQLVPRGGGEVDAEQLVEGVGQLFDSHLDGHWTVGFLEHVFDSSSPL